MSVGFPFRCGNTAPHGEACRAAFGAVLELRKYERYLSYHSSELRGSSTELSATASIVGLAAAPLGIARAPRRLDIPPPPRRSKAALDPSGRLRRVRPETTRRLRNSEPEPQSRPGLRVEPSRPRQGGVVASAGALPLATISSAFLAQHLAQEVMPESPRDGTVAHQRGLDRYHDVLAHGVAVIGPADFRGLVV
jgi:hypothetical protein